MNFSDFDHLKKRSQKLTECLNDCFEAEQNARTRPMHALTVTRRALENLMIEKCGEYGIEFDTLSVAIKDVCYRLPQDYRQQKIRKNAHFLRVTGNNVVHPDPKINKLIHAATEERIDVAMEALEKMYRILGMLYGYTKGKSFDRDRVPFDHYEIVRQIHDPANPNLKRYFVRGVNGRSYYLQCLSHREMAELELRRQDANKLVYEMGQRRGNRLLLPISLPLPEDSDRKLLLYDAFPESFLLTELKGKMKLKQALDLGLDLIEALEQLHGLGMRHRNIYPGCIMVDRAANGGYDAFLMDLQSSKIESSDMTVNAKLVSAYDSSQYVPSILWGKPLQDVDWEKVDVYSVCRVVLFCLDRTLVQISSTSRFRDYAELKYAGGMRELYSRVFQPGPDLANIPTLDELKELFRNERNQCK